MTHQNLARIRVVTVSQGVEYGFAHPFDWELGYAQLEQADFDFFFGVERPFEDLLHSLDGLEQWPALQIVARHAGFTGVHDIVKLSLRAMLGQHLATSKQQQACMGHLTIANRLEPLQELCLVDRSIRRKVPCGAISGDHARSARGRDPLS
ncbi:hypothetical protein D3C78_1156460 [compost metagenome]